MRLTKTQKKEVFGLVTARGFNPADFTLEVCNDDETILIHEPSRSQIAIAEIMVDATQITKVALRSVIEDGPHRETWVDADAAWAGEVGFWLNEVRRELATPDPWAELNREKKILTAAAAGDADNAPFNNAEKQQALRQLDEIKAYAEKTYGLVEGWKEAA